MKSYRVIGLMSGTSMDGLDLADVTFCLSKNEQWEFKINHTKLYPYSMKMKEKLIATYAMTATDLTEFNSHLGRYYAEKVNEYLDYHKIDKKDIDLIASHGQTVFHQPKKGYTLQIGNGPELAVFSQLPTVVDFRTKDVALGGNGAPLIPVADYLLFKQYAEAFLNLGGFANLSFKEDGRVYSFDICPTNIVINDLVKVTGVEYDEGGQLGRGGTVHNELLKNLNTLAYYRQEGPKSLGWEWVESEFLPLLQINIELKDIIRTLYEHYAIQIAKVLNEKNVNSVLITGGGAKNTFLIERIRYFMNGEVIVPSPTLIDFKEAVGFAFLGLLRTLDQPNVWCSVTGAQRDSCSGQIILP